MNAKKCKRVRRTMRLIQQDYPHIPANGLLYRDTRKQVAWVFPTGWLRTSVIRLAIAGGPWYKEALSQAKPLYARQAVNVPVGLRALCRVNKAHHGS